MDLNSYLKTHLAKSSGISIEEHVQDLLEQLNTFVKRYPGVLTREEKKLLETAVRYHDHGKLNKLFQCKLPVNHQLKREGCPKFRKDDKIAHQFLSPLFLRELEDKMDYLDLVVIIYSIINHHARGQDKYLKQGYYGVDFLLKEIKENVAEFFSHMGITQLSNETEKFYRKHLEYIVEEITDVKNLNQKFEREPEFVRKLVKVAGLLIRIDHAASGKDLVTEEPPIQKDRESLFKEYLAKNNRTEGGKGISLRPFQEKFRSAHNLVLVADTGLGKTGLAVLWSKRKMFYVLPNRTSTNAMYDTLGKIFGKGNVGLLHSTSLFYIAESKDIEDYTVLRDYDNTRNLSKPITVATADQLFTAVFKYPTYEKIYATLSYSDIVIDEIQGFDPAQVVPIIRQIKETTKIGARYLIITATLPGIVRREFEKLGFEVKTNDPETIDRTKRHKVEIYSDDIFSTIDEIVGKAKKGKNVLVIVNTVATAQDVFENLKYEKGYGKTKLLHSRFIWEHRKNKEREINQDYKQEKGVIWVTTQLVEASLDIDFDILFTEVATADSLIQRMGRVWRHRKEDYRGEPNVYILTKVDEKKVSLIYEKPLRDKSIELISENLDNEGYLLSEAKRKIVETLYSEETLKFLDSKYFEKWKKIESILDSNWDFLFKKEAQRIFRDVFTFEAIPYIYKDEVESLISELKATNQIPNKEERRSKKVGILRDINRFRVPVPIYWISNNEGKLILNDKICQLLDKDLGICCLGKCFEYSEELGLKPNKKLLKEYKFNFDETLFI